jgi:hypothetical protein
LSNLGILREWLGALNAGLWTFLKTVHLILYGARTTLVFIAFIVFAFVAMPQAEELALTRVESPLALLRVVGGFVWFAATIWHCCEAKISSSAVSLAGDFATFCRRTMPTLLAIGFAGTMVAAELQALHTAALLPTEPVRLYPVLEMHSLGIVFLPGILRSIDGRVGRYLACTGEAVLLALRSRNLFGLAHLALFVWAAAAPIGFAWTVGPEATLLLAASCWLTAITYAQLYWRRKWGPVLAAAGVLLIVISCFTDSHSIRCSDCDAASFPQTQERTSAATDEDDRTASIQGPAPAANKLYAYEFLKQIDESRPIVLVSAAGGGLRAAYWTATILGELQDRFPTFDQHTFMISGVSGGSLGAGVYRALLQHARRGKAIACRNGTGQIVTGYRQCGQAILDHDFTGPVLAALLFRDLLPLPGLLDRAGVLEEAWEAAWRSTMIEPGEGLARRFDQIDAVSRFPVLMLNGVSALTGERILAGGLSENENLLNVAKIRPLPLSAAIGISTRFPFVEPAGSLYDRKGHFYDSVVDGGYVENFGSNSALEVLRDIGNLIQDDREPHPTRLRQFIRTALFVQISSDPTLDDGSNLLFSDGLSSMSALPMGLPTSTRTVINLQQIWLPLFALMRGQSTQSTFTASLVSTYVASINGVFSHFRLADRYAHAPVLGWTLSKRSQIQIDSERIQTASQIISHLEPLLASP